MLDNDWFDLKVTSVKWMNLWYMTFNIYIIYKRQVFKLFKKGVLNQFATILSMWSHGKKNYKKITCSKGKNLKILSKKFLAKWWIFVLKALQGGTIWGPLAMKKNILCKFPMSLPVGGQIRTYHICTYTHTHICIHIQIHTRTHTHTHTHTHVPPWCITNGKLNGFHERQCRL